MNNKKDISNKIDLAQLRKLFERFYEDATTRYLPNLDAINNGSNVFTNFIDAVRENPEVLGNDDSEINMALLDYQSEYAFAAFGVGFALGKLTDLDTDDFDEHINAAMPKDNFLFSKRSNKKKLNRFLRKNGNIKNF